MIALIAPEVDVENELDILNQLFNEGLVFYHLRKPNKSLKEYVSYLNSIDSQYHDRIMLHFYHHLADEFNVKGVHLQEQVRLKLGSHLPEYVSSYREKGLTVSSSFHEPEMLKSCETDFDYHLLSPVFSSISKVGYVGRVFNVTGIDKFIVGMGGINVVTIEQTLELGYKGIGVLGSVWNAEQPAENFKNIKSHYEEARRGNLPINQQIASFLSP